MGLAAVLLVCGCSARSPEVGSGTGVTAVAAEEAPVVRTELRNILDSVRLEGTVEAYPPVDVLSPESGELIPAGGDLAYPREVVAGQVIGKVRRCDASAERRPSADATAAASSTAAPETTADTPCASWRTWDVAAPAAGALVSLDRGQFEKGAVISQIQPGGLRGRLAVPDPSVLYRFLDPPETLNARILGGPGTFPVTFGSVDYDPGTQTSTVLVGIPADVSAFPGLAVVVVFGFGATGEVATLPLTAVRGRTERGQVVAVQTDGTHQVVDVVLGASDSLVIQVEGIEPDQDVLRYPLESDFAP